MDDVMLKQPLVADLLKVSTRHVRDLVAESKLVSNSASLIPLRSVWNYREAQFESERVGWDKEKEDARFRRLKNSKLEIEVNRLQGEVISLSEVVHQVGVIVQTLRQKLITEFVPAVADPVLGCKDSRDVAALLDKELRVALTAAADELEKIGSGEQAEAPDGAGAGVGCGGGNPPAGEPGPGGVGGREPAAGPDVGRGPAVPAV